MEQRTEFNMVPVALLEHYRAAVAGSDLERSAELEESELSVDSFSFYTAVSAVYSSKIEGEDIELDPYVKHKRFGISFLPDHTQKYDALDHEAALPFLLMLPKALVL